MTYKAKILFLLTVLITGCCGVNFAQEMLGPLLYNPQIKKERTIPWSTMRTTAAVLPFFEDFTGYNADPDTGKWADRQVYINNTMAVNMISRGVATFDILNQYGLPYDTINTFSVRYADSLTSKEIDLSSYKPSDSIYISFFYQPGGNGFAPEKQDSLMLFFRTKQKENWIKVWSKGGSTLEDFKQVMIAVTDTNFLQSNFQFRFVNKISLGTGTWNLDYIRMDAGRKRSDTFINDVAFTTTPTNLLNDYTAMPYRQYIANAGAERAAKFQSTIKNNFTGSQNIASFGYTAKELTSGSALSSDAGVNRNIAAGNTTNTLFDTYNATPGSGLYDKVIFENKYYLQAPLGDAHKENDTIIGQQVFDNYLAYDDGTAELSYYLNLSTTLPGKIAIEHHLNQADTLRGIAIYFHRKAPLEFYKLFSIVVYKSITYGSSTADNIIYQAENLVPGYIDTINHFWIYKFDKPIPLPKGTFYIGTTQPALSGSDSLHFGWDVNRTTGNHLYYNTTNVWASSSYTGALMMRPLLGAPITGTSVKESYHNTAARDFKLFPNPATHRLQISITDADKDTRYEITNLLGIKVATGMITSEQHSVDISDLPNALYLIQLFSGEQRYTIQKFSKQ